MDRWGSKGYWSHNKIIIFEGDLRPSCLVLKRLCFIIFGGDKCPKGF